MIKTTLKVCHFKWHTLTKLFITIFFLQTLLSCQKEITYESELKPSLVVNAIYTNEKPFTFHFSTTSLIFDPYVTITDSLHFIFYADNKIVLDTSFISDSLVTNILPRPDVHYSFEVRSPSFETLSAADSLPKIIDIKEATIKAPVGIDQYGEAISEAAITFQDLEGERNYYELLIYSLAGIGRNYWISDGEEIIYDPVILNEGDKDYSPKSYFFSDELFDGSEYTIHIRKTGYGKGIKTGATLRSVSKNYYLYRKYYTRHAHNQQTGVESRDDFLYMGEPQNMYTNIENGYGIFAGFQETATVLVEIE